MRRVGAWRRANAAFYWERRGGALPEAAVVEKRAEAACLVYIRMSGAAVRELEVRVK